MLNRHFLQHDYYIMIIIIEEFIWDEFKQKQEILFCNLWVFLH